MPTGTTGEGSAVGDDDGNAEVTEALLALRGGSPEAMERLLPLVYDQLRRVARRQLGREETGHTLTTTALVHEAYLRLVDQTRTDWQDRVHFFAVASGAMRRVLIDHARRHRAVRRGGSPEGTPAVRVALDSLALPSVDRAESLLALDEALERLADFDPSLARVVEYRFFGGLTEEEVATALGVSRRTVARSWAAARGWLYDELHGAGD